MAKFRCLCGEIISTSGDIPNPHEWHLLSDVEFLSFEPTVTSDEIYQATKLAYRCPKSGHLWVFWDGLDEDPSVYEPVELPSDDD